MLPFKLVLWTNSYSLCLFLLVSVSAANYYETDDAIVIEVPETHRAARAVNVHDAHESPQVSSESNSAPSDLKLKLETLANVASADNLRSTAPKSKLRVQPGVSLLNSSSANSLKRSGNDLELLEVGDQRDRRQFGGGFFWPGGYPIGPCFTSKGQLGRCTSFRQCYPYFKLPELNNWETWVLGMYDTCSYFTSSGRQMFGVCCTNPAYPTTPRPGQPPRPDPPAVPTHEPTPVTSESPPTQPGPVPPDWPPTHPPLPTHSEPQTHPPLPTHAPSTTTPWPYPYPTNPTTTSTTYQPIQTRPTTTTSRPPTYPTHPPPPPPTTAAPVNDGQCGVKNWYQDQERIVGGQNAEPNEWPWMAALFNGGRQFCGGSLIDNVHILSAAHCVAHMSSWDVARLTVRLGDHNIRLNSETQHLEKKVKRIVRHRGFDARTLYNDVAILTLDSPVTFTKNIRPICLPSGSTSYAGRTGTVIGWGSLRESGPQPAILQKVNIRIWTNQDCKSKYGHQAPGGIVEHFLCAGQESQDSCSGDSGGPLMIYEGRRWMQVGIVSWGIGCGKGQYPGVYTRVTHFLPWIQKNLK